MWWWEKKGELRCGRIEVKPRFPCWLFVFHIIIYCYTCAPLSMSLCLGLCGRIMKYLYAQNTKSTPIYVYIYIYTVHIYICIRCISWCVFSKCGLFVGRSCRLAFCAQRNLYTQLIYLHRIEVCNVLSSWWCLKQSSAFGVRVSTNTKFSISDENNLTSIINVFPENNRENDLRCLWL